MVDQRDIRDARKITTDVLGEAIVEFDQKAKEAEEEASRLEIQGVAFTKLPIFRWYPCGGPRGTCQ